MAQIFHIYRSMRAIVNKFALVTVVCLIFGRTAAVFAQRTASTGEGSSVVSPSWQSLGGVTVVELSLEDILINGVAFIEIPDELMPPYEMEGRDLKGPKVSSVVEYLKNRLEVVFPNATVTKNGLSPYQSNVRLVKYGQDKFD